MGNVSVGIGALSYAGQFNITAVADRDLIPDAGIFADGMRQSLRALEDVSLVTTGRGAATQRSGRTQPSEIDRRQETP